MLYGIGMQRVQSQEAMIRAEQALEQAQVARAQALEAEAKHLKDIEHKSNNSQSGAKQNNQKPGADKIEVRGQKSGS